METTISKIREAKEKALSGKRLDRELMLMLLNIKEDTPEFIELGKAAREVASVITKDKSYTWGAIGIDFKPCEMNCEFCSMGEKWGVITDANSYVMELHEIIERVQDYVNCGIRWIVLRTTQHYSLDTLIKIIKEIKSQVTGDYELGLNVGEFNDLYANAFYEAGLNFIYHSIRLREGIQTPFDPKHRLATLSAVKQSKLNLVYLVEPIGIEHTNEEIAEIYETILSCNTNVSGGMARIPVIGTPVGDKPQISENRLAQIIAFTRLASAGVVEDICVHPMNTLAMSFGANVTVIESGAIPRDSKYSQDIWNGLTHQDAVKMFKEQGYETLSKKP